MTSSLQAIPNPQKLSEHLKPEQSNEKLCHVDPPPHKLTKPALIPPSQHLGSLRALPTKVILQAGSAHGRGLVLRTLQVCASIPGQQGGACAQHGHLGRGSGWLTFHLGSRRLGGLAESLLKTVGGEGRRGGT